MLFYTDLSCRHDNYSADKFLVYIYDGLFEFTYVNVMGAAAYLIFEGLPVYSIISLFWHVIFLLELK